MWIAHRYIKTGLYIIAPTLPQNHIILRCLHVTKLSCIMECTKTHIGAAQGSILGKQMLRLVPFAITLFLLSLPVRAVVIGFESPLCPTCGIGTTNYSEAGVQFTSRFTHYGTENSGNAGNGSLGAIRTPSQSYIDGITTTSGDLFSLVSVELAEYSVVQLGDQVTVNFVGVKADDSLISQSFTIDGIIDGVGGANDFELFTFSSGFTGLKSAYVERTNYSGLYDEYFVPGFSMDNMQMSIVPVPAAAWLFGSALAGLSWIRRKQAP